MNLFPHILIFFFPAIKKKSYISPPREGGGKRKKKLIALKTSCNTLLAKLTFPSLSFLRQETRAEGKFHGVAQSAQREGGTRRVERREERKRRQTEEVKQRPLSAQVLVCGVPLRFPLFAVALVVTLAALVALGVVGRRGVLLALRALVLPVLFGLRLHTNTKTKQTHRY